MKKNTTKTKLIIVVLALIVVVAAILFGTTDAINRRGDMVVAKVNNAKIYKSEVENKLAEVLQNDGGKVDISQFPREVLETIVKDIYVQKQLENKARKSKVAKNAEVQKKIANYSNKILLKAYLESLIADQVNDTAVRNKYAELSSEYSGKKEMHLKHILVNSESDANKILAELKTRKSSFEQLAKKNSLDKSNSDLGGDLGYVIADNLDDDFAKVVETLKKGQTSGAIKTKFGWHIVKVEDVRKVQIPDFAKIKSEIESRLRQEVAEKMFDDIANKATVKIMINQATASTGAEKIEEQSQSNNQPVSNNSTTKSDKK